MVESIVVCIIAIFFISAVFFAWFFYQQARDKERKLLIERGDKLEAILEIQKKNKFKFIFPWLKLGVVTSSLSVAFLVIAFLIRWLDNDVELFKGFLITCIIGFCLGLAFFINHFAGKKK
jgi:CBS domain containing-hemolysin-like protein